MATMSDGGNRALLTLPGRARERQRFVIQVSAFCGQVLTGVDRRRVAVTGEAIDYKQHEPRLARYLDNVESVSCIGHDKQPTRPHTVAGKDVSPGVSPWSGNFPPPLKFLLDISGQISVAVAVFRSEISHRPEADIKKHHCILIPQTPGGTNPSAFHNQHLLIY